MDGICRASKGILSLQHASGEVQNNVQECLWSCTKSIPSTWAIAPLHSNEIIRQSILLLHLPFCYLASLSYIITTGDMVHWGVHLPCTHMNSCSKHAQNCCTARRHKQAVKADISMPVGMRKAGSCLPSPLACTGFRIVQFSSQTINCVPGCALPFVVNLNLQERPT